MSTFPWLRLDSAEPYTYVPGDKPGTMMKEPAPAASGEVSPAQIAPPLIPATREQQRSTSSAAVQYGGAEPYNTQTADKSTLALAALGIGLAWMYLRQK